MATSSRNATDSNRPVHTVRYGVIKAAVWRNVVDNGDASRAIYNVTLSRSYRDGDEWKESASLGYDDLLVAAKALNECHTYVHEQIALERQRQGHEDRDAERAAVSKARR
jgi:hypothetical protein